MTYAVGSLVAARGREWVVLPGTDDELVMVRPLGGTEDEATGILTALEPVAPAMFALPDPAKPGDFRSARLLRDALRLGFRSSAGPFRSIGAIAVEPRPYQLVPLLMALRLDPVRLLIADDVGIGKTIEAALIAREMLEQGDVRRMAILCPPHLAEQWKEELDSKFHIDAQLVLASTAARLERGLPVGRTIFDEYPHVIVSTDFIKADRHRDDFIRTCPELVIIDEAHTCAADQGVKNRARHQRHELVRQLASDPDRHVILVTATPHSGKEGAFRSLLTLLDPSFEQLPDDLSGDHNRRYREQLARHLVQRKRGDISALLASTTFPERVDEEHTYRLSGEYRALFDEVLEYAREIVRDPAEGHHRQRVRWWSALALLRSMASSPAAAAATLRTRAATVSTETPEEADTIGRQTVLDIGDDESAESTDVVAGADLDPDDDNTRARRRLREMAKQADALHGKGDLKLQQALQLVSSMLDEGRQPIVFCRFIPTAEYVADALRTHLKRTDVHVEAITGNLPPAEREARIEAMGAQPRRVLVATDCLSEGINLQNLFDAVLHYDLPWNPTRLEQREGRVDRFGQAAKTVKVATYYGADNGIDQIVLDVLLRKHRTIRNTLGVSIPVPGDTNSVIEAVAESLLIAETGPIDQVLPGMEEYVKPRQAEFAFEWDRAADRERQSRRLFAQHGIKVEEVATELDAIRAAVGSGADVEQFMRTATVALDGHVVGDDAVVELDFSGAKEAVRDLVVTDRVRGRFQPPVSDGQELLGRTHPVVNGVASYLMTTALDPQVESPARRSGVIRTAAVSTRTTLLLVRQRFHIVTVRGGEESPMLAEDCAVLGFTGSPTSPAWLDDASAQALLLAEPSGNVVPGEATSYLTEALAAAATWADHLAADTQRRADALLAAHERVRDAARQKGVRFRVVPQPVDVLGVYVYLPGGAR